MSAFLSNLRGILSLKLMPEQWKIILWIRKHFFIMINDMELSKRQFAPRSAPAKVRNVEAPFEDLVLLQIVNYSYIRGC